MTATLIILTLLLGWAALQRFGLSFAAQRPQDYAATAPGFDLRQALDGPMLSEGVIFGPTGRVAGRFVARMEGRWQGERGTLTEEFRFASGAVQARTWRLMLRNDGSFTATADDVVGTAHGEQSGAAVRMRYRLRLDEDAGGHVLDVTDWLYLMEDGAIMNRSEMRKFGIKVGELIATMRPSEADSGAPLRHV